MSSSPEQVPPPPPQGGPAEVAAYRQRLLTIIIAVDIVTGVLLIPIFYYGRTAAAAAKNDPCSNYIFGLLLLPYVEILCFACFASSASFSAVLKLLIRYYYPAERGAPPRVLLNNVVVHLIHSCAAHAWAALMLLSASGLIIVGGKIGCQQKIGMVFLILGVAAMDMVVTASFVVVSYKYKDFISIRCQ